MKQSMETEDLHSLFTDTEFEVAETLLNLGNMIRKFELRCRPRQLFTIVWNTRKRLVFPGARKKSTTPYMSLPNLANPSASLSQTRYASSPFPSLQQRTSLPLNQTDSRTSEQLKVKPNSPVSPLSFSESDDKSANHSHSQRKNFKKRTREELMVAIEGLTDCKKMLEEEITTVKNYYDKLLTFDAELKNAKRQQRVLSTHTCHERQEQTYLEIKHCQIGVVKVPMAVESQTPETRIEIA